MLNARGELRHERKRIQQLIRRLVTPTDGAYVQGMR